MEEEYEYLAECAAMLPWNEGKSNTDLIEFIREEDYYVEALAQDQIDAFWEEFVHPCDECAFSSMST